MFAENIQIQSMKVGGLVVRGFDSDLKLKLPSVYTREIMPCDRSHIPTAKMAEKLEHLKQMSDRLMPVNDYEIGLLIGYECPKALLPREVIAPEEDGPFAQRTDLGWGIVGIIDCNCDDDDRIGHSHRILAYEVVGSKPVQVSLKSQTKELIFPRDVLKVSKSDFQDELHGVGLFRDDQKFLDIMQKSISEDEVGHYVMPLSFRDKKPILCNYMAVAQKRLNQLKTKLDKNTKYKSEYVTFMADIVEKDYAELVPDCDFNKDEAWYIPHHGVYNEQKGKLRIVFDCSSKCQGK